MDIVRRPNGALRETADPAAGEHAHSSVIAVAPLKLSDGHRARRNLLTDLEVTQMADNRRKFLRLASGR